MAATSIPSEQHHVVAVAHRLLPSPFASPERYSPPVASQPIQPAPSWLAAVWEPAPWVQTTNSAVMEKPRL